MDVNQFMEVFDSASDIWQKQVQVPQNLCSIMMCVDMHFRYLNNILQKNCLKIPGCVTEVGNASYNNLKRGMYKSAS